MKKIFISLLLFITIAFFVNNKLAYATDVSGTLSTNTTWSLANSPFNVTSDFTVSDGVTLTIEPGVQVIIGNNFKINIEGNLISRGTSGNYIKFTANDTTTRWNGLKISRAAGNDSTILEYTQIEYSKSRGLQINSDSVLVNHCKINNNKAGLGAGIFINKCKAVITNSIICYNTATSNHAGGIYANNGNLLLINNQVYNNATAIDKKGGGLYTYESESVILINNTFVNNTATMGFEACFQGKGPVKLYNNVFWEDFDSGNKSVYLYCGTYYLYNNAIKNGNYAPCNPINMYRRGSTYNLSRYNTSSIGPNFTDPDNDDYTFTYKSILANRGDTTNVSADLPDLDFAGTNRIKNSYIDLGAYESDYKTYNATFLADTNGSLYCEGVSSNEFNYYINGGCSTNEVMAKKRIGYHFKEWQGTSGDTISTNYRLTITNITSDTTVIAIYEPDTFTVRFKAAENGYILGDTLQYIDYSDSTVAIEAMGDYGYSFKEWQGANGEIRSTDNPLIIRNITTDSTYTALFELSTYTVNFSTSTGGSLTGSVEQSITHGYGSAAISAVPESGYHFVEWQSPSGSRVSTANPLTVTNVISDSSLTAVFILDGFYSVTFVSGTNGTISGEQQQTIEEGSDATQVEAIPASGYNFAYWQTSEGDIASYDNPLIVENVSSDTSFTAVFELFGANSLSKTKPNNVKVFPNPASDILTIENSSKIENIQIISVTGIVISSRVVNNTNTQLNMHDLPCGIYIIRINTSEGSVTERIMKQ